ncbi:MAG: hypothetical protein A2808_00750 [Candidatus Moranbacteria bacterium RIFCSPHIGHO2_01_FULL_55_24]|nr:MAG: hypothetical protein A2808_00750 [Candidatus Moranbacteria bacterium RIFCSPHIGHO2_01_FULL_55_24]
MFITAHIKNLIRITPCPEEMFGSARVKVAKEKLFLIRNHSMQLRISGLLWRILVIGLLMK